MTRVRFGTDGIRGRSGIHPITDEVARGLGEAVVEQYAARNLYVAHDTREDGPALGRAVCQGAIAKGAEATLLGVWPTPALSVALANGEADAGVMVTASHNGWRDNGFKVLAIGGRKPNQGEILAMERRLRPTSGTEEIRAVEPKGNQAPDTWLRALEREALKVSDWADRPIAFDLANGAASRFRDDLARIVPARWRFVGGGEGRINEGVGSEHLGTLGAKVVEWGCELGLAVDGDADRLRVVDEQGRTVDGDAVTWLLCRDMELKRVAVTVMSNAALEEHLPGVHVTRTPVGDRHLQEALIHHHAQLGAEESGHILFKDHPGGDGFFAALRVMGALSRRPERSSEVFSGFRPFPHAKREIPVVQKPVLDDVPGLTKRREGWVSELGRSGRVLLRYSGTEPVLRILVEGEDGDRVERTSDEVEATLREVLG